MMRDRIRRRSDSEPVGSLCMCGIGCVSTVAPRWGCLPGSQLITVKVNVRLRGCPPVVSRCHRMPFSYGNSFLPAASVSDPFAN